MLPAPDTDGLLWKKSSRSAGNGACVEVAMTADGVAVRDSKDRTGPVLNFAGESWDEFLAAVREGQYDRRV